MAIFKKILNFFNGVQNFSIEHYMTMSAIGAVIFIRNLSTSTHYMQREQRKHGKANFTHENGAMNV